MKKVLAFFLFATVLVSPLTNTLIYLHYEIFKSYYTQVLCENRNYPKLHCNGHCRLKQELNNAEKRSNQPLSSIKEEKEVILINESTQLNLPKLPVVEIALPCACTSDNFSEAYLLSVFRPPKA